MLNSRARQLAADRRYEYFMPAHVIGIEGKGMADLQFTILTKAIVAIGAAFQCVAMPHMGYHWVVGGQVLLVPATVI